MELPDGHDAVDVFACATRPVRDALRVSDALELLQLCVQECCPGAQNVIHILGEHGASHGG